MSMFPCKKCGGMIGVVGTTVYKCGCPPPTPEEIAAIQAERMKEVQNAENGIGVIIANDPPQIKVVQRLNESFACLETVREALGKVGLVCGVEANVYVEVGVRVSIPVEKRRQENGELVDMTPIFEVEQQMMEKFPNVSFDFNVAWEYVPAEQPEPPAQPPHVDVQA